MQPMPHLQFSAGADEDPTLWLLSWLTYLALVTLYLADGILPQIQLLLMGGSAPMTSAFKPTILLLVLASVLERVS